MRAKSVNEQRFEQGQDPKEAMGIGVWKDWDSGSGAEQQNGVKISIDEFLENGGKLERGREIWTLRGNNIWPYATYWEFKDGKHWVEYREPGNIISLEDTRDYGPRVETKVIYK